jgi:hypothetical protein
MLWSIRSTAITPMNDRAAMSVSVPRAALRALRGCATAAALFLAIASAGAADPDAASADAAAGGIEWHPAAVTEAAREKMIGTWYGDRRERDERIRWVIARSVDGTYRIDFEVTSASGRIERNTELGIWGIRYPIYFTSVQAFVEGSTTFPADTGEPSLYDAYRVIELDEMRFVYASFTSGNTFEVRRVADGFRLDTGAPRPPPPPPPAPPHSIKR